MRKIDLGEFTCFTRDFEIKLPRTKLTEVFRKASINLQEMEFKNFTNSITDLGVHFSKAKLKENKARLKELTLVAK
jgi:hypothetical protein